MTRRTAISSLLLIGLRPLPARASETALVSGPVLSPSGRYLGFVARGRGGRGLFAVDTATDQVYTPGLL